jgi:ribosome-associated protein
MRVMTRVHIPDDEVALTAIRAQGPGGQNVNKVSSAIQLRFDVRASTLPEDIKARWLQAPGNHLTPDGVLILKAQRYRTQEANRQDAWARLYEMLERYERAPKARKATRPTRASVQKRLQSKALHARLKTSRRQQGD